MIQRKRIGDATLIWSDEGLKLLQKDTGRVFDKAMEHDGDRAKHEYEEIPDDSQDE